LTASQKLGLKTLAVKGVIGIKAIRKPIGDKEPIFEQCAGAYEKNNEDNKPWSASELGKSKKGGT